MIIKPEIIIIKFPTIIVHEPEIIVDKIQHEQIVILIIILYLIIIYNLFDSLTIAPRAPA